MIVNDDDDGYDDDDDDDDDDEQRLNNNLSKIFGPRECVISAYVVANGE